MKKFFKNSSIARLIKMGIDLPLVPIAILIIVPNIMLYTINRLLSLAVKRKKPRLLFASTPIISLAYISRSLKRAGFSSAIAVTELSRIYRKDDFDYVLIPKWELPRPIKFICSNILAYAFFIRSIWKYDIFHFYFDGGLLKRTLLSRFELYILKLCGKKIILLPYGSDSFVYDLIPDPIWRHALMIHYPEFGNQAGLIQNRLRRMSQYADIVIACLVHFVNLPRWDILPLTCYPINTHELTPVSGLETNTIRIAHATNHRGIKGTEFLVAAVDSLKQKGFDVELDIIENVNNKEALKRMSCCNIYVDQLIFGYAQAALEAMALGKIVISAIEQTPAYNIFRRYSYLNECPIIPANAESIESVLHELLHKRGHWPVMQKQSRLFVENRHSFSACADMFEAIYRKIWWQDENVNLMNFYHPLFEKKL